MKKIVLISSLGFVLLGVLSWGYYSQLIPTIKTPQHLPGLQSLFDENAVFEDTLDHDYGGWHLEDEKVTTSNILGNKGLTLGTYGNLRAYPEKSRLSYHMINVVYDFNKISNSKSVKPFIGGGLGVANIDLLNLSTSAGFFTNRSDPIMAFQMFAGLRVPLNNSIEMSIKYRYLATTNANMMDRLGNHFQTSYGSHDFRVGLTYRFGGPKRKPLRVSPKPIAGDRFGYAP